VTTIIAAGGVVRRDTGEVLLVHRPRYDDWSLPKGKLLAGEHVLAAAVREVHEETGLRVRLGPPLGVQRYDVRKNGGTVPKLVHYWAAVPVADGNDFEPNDEVDELAWCSLEGARQRLSYPRDAALLDILEDVSRPEATLVLLRHTTAVKRKEWDGKDTARPLSEAGVAAAERLVDVLGALGADRLLSSDTERCFATVAPYAARAGLTIEEHPEISERGYESDPSGLRGFGATAWAPGRVTVVCSHRPVLPALSRDLGLKIGKFSPGAFVTAHRLSNDRQITERFSAP
jgi:8-oxo-dGTP pyrophosphatase MutT (NUDIX family)/phosphohistidine phosphatase SixA